MTTSATETTLPRASAAVVTDDTLTVDLVDGRSVSVPLTWYPRLLHGSPDERRRWQLIARGEGIHWPDLDEDISVSSLIAGRPSQESAASLERWLAGRRT
jgi:Protein of unknown function (DUF2442)